MNRRLSLIIGVVCFGFGISVLSAAEVTSNPKFTAEQIEFFESHVRPVLVEHCYDCHSTDAPELKAELYVDSRDAMIKGGESGAAIVVGKPGESSLIAAVKYESNEMPPDRKLPQKDIDALVKWVELGAPWPEVTSTPAVAAMTEQTIDWQAARQNHWAWQAVVQPAVPAVDFPAANGAIDKFIYARRDKMGLPVNEPAPPRVLARRIYVDLVGIVPTPDQVEAFVGAANENRQLAVDSLVNELLQSPLYGQRWARHWLDVARYSTGRGGFLDNNVFDSAWRYRDWVVNALNDDLPINDFIRLQVAGDVIGDRDDAIATGFFALGPTYRSDGGDPDSVAQAKGETLDDRIDTLTRGLLGITGSCARCHDHKFDPIPQIDYYSLAGVFNNSVSHDLPLVDQEIVTAFDEHKKSISELDKKIKKLNQQLKKEKRKATTDEQAELDKWKPELEELKKSQSPQYDVAHTLRESGSGDMHVAIRGNLRKTGELAPRRFLRVLAGAQSSPFTTGSGRQQLAEAIVDPTNPLTARVFVNRVWRQHFAAGIVRTPSNFGTLGEPPTHPQLLDWLAADFVKNGWSLKRLHRQIMTSSTYALSSAYNADAFQSDGDNRFLWRMTPRRMDVESWRDSLLAVCGELDTAAGGPSLPDISHNKRRTLYAKVSRNGDVFESDAFLRRFDFPLMRATVAKRPQSVVPQQFLFLLNSPFMVDRATALVKRLHADRGTQATDQARIELAYQFLYNRRATETEMQIGIEFLQTAPNESEKISAWDQYAQALLSSNEFMYIR